MSYLEVKNLCIDFPTRTGNHSAVKNVCFSVDRGESLGIVGESGSGKSVSVSSVMGLVQSPPAKISGSALLDGQELIGASAATLRSVRGQKISMIFQDPMTSLNPHMRIVDQVGEPLRRHQNLNKKEARGKAIEVLEQVGIPDAARRGFNWPHEFSGGMRQRVMIAMAMISRPDVLIADEPTTALDVTVQRQILELLAQLQKETGMALILISHDLAVVSDVCDRIAVMQKGKVVEHGSTKDVLSHPSHAYTKGLLSCHPGHHSPGTRLTTLEEVLDAEA